MCGMLVKSTTYCGVKYSDPLQALLPEDMEQLVGNIAAIADRLPRQALGQFRDGLAVIDVTGGEAEGQQLAPIIDHEMELEAVEPTHGGFAPAGHLLENLVVVNAAVVADHQGGGIDEDDPGVLAPPGVQVDGQRHQGGGNQGHKPSVAQQGRKLVPAVPAAVQEVKGFEIAVLGV